MLMTESKSKLAKQFHTTTRPWPTEHLRLSNCDIFLFKYLHPCIILVANWPNWIIFSEYIRITIAIWCSSASLLSFPWLKSALWRTNICTDNPAPPFWTFRLVGRSWSRLPSLSGRPQISCRPQCCRVLAEIRPTSPSWTHSPPLQRAIIVILVKYSFLNLWIQTSFLPSYSVIIIWLESSVWFWISDYSGSLSNKLPGDINNRGISQNWKKYQIE